MHVLYGSFLGLSDSVQLNEWVKRTIFFTFTFIHYKCKMQSLHSSGIFVIEEIFLLAPSNKKLPNFVPGGVLLIIIYDNILKYNPWTTNQQETFP